MFRTTLTRLLLVPLAALLAASTITAVHASTPTAASGTTTVTTCTFTNPRPIGNSMNTIVDIACDETWTGTFSGTATGHGTLMINNANGTARSDTVETFTGTVNGIAGTVTYNGSAESTPTGDLQGTYILVSGTGGLTNITGVLHLTGNVLGPLPASGYTGQIHLGN